MRDCIQFDDAICRYAIHRYLMYVWDMRDEAISESYKYISFSSIDGSLIYFFSLKL